MRSHALSSTDHPGQRLINRLAAFARHTDEPGKMTRLYLSDAHRRAAEELIGWLEAAGFAARIDAIGNVVGRLEGTVPGAPAVVLGSHIDTVRDAGIYDGNFGVLAALEALEQLREDGERLPYPVEIVAFGDEEGVRFPSTLSGSKALAGTFDPKALDVSDDTGTTLRDALVRFGCDPQGIAALARPPGSIRAFIELHIEQGPVLEAAGLPVGVVTAINGATRSRVSLTGTAGHAGTVPMDLRRDALAAAAEMILAIEALARRTPALVATVGRLVAAPGAVNVIPGAVTFTIDVRAPDDTLRHASVAEIERLIGDVAATRGIGIEIARNYDAPAAPCNPDVIAGLSAAIAANGWPVKQLPSGAGHDTMALAPVFPSGMLFVRCRGGISHNPAESITAEDAAAAVAVLTTFLRQMRDA